jgi:hypothetical protein
LHGILSSEKVNVCPDSCFWYGPQSSVEDWVHGRCKSQRGFSKDIVDCLVEPRSLVMFGFYIAGVNGLVSSLGGHGNGSTPSGVELHIVKASFKLFTRLGSDRKISVAREVLLMLPGPSRMVFLIDWPRAMFQVCREISWIKNVWGGRPRVIRR